MGGHDYAGTHIFHASPLTGIATSNNNSDHFDVLNSIVGNVSVDDAHFTGCGFIGTVTLAGVGTATPGELRLVNCFSLVSGSGNPVIDFGTGSENHNVIISNWQNGLEIQNFNVVTTGGTDLLSLSGSGLLIINANCDGGTIHLRGSWKITDNSSGAVTLVEDDSATTVKAASTAAALATVDGIVDTLLLGVITGSAATGTLSTTQATTELTGYADDQLIGRVLIVTSGDAEGEATDITDYTNVNGLLTFTALTTAMANNDTFKIV